MRPRKHPDRSRDRYYDRDRDRGGDRGKDRSLDRGKERNGDRALDRDRGRMQDGDKQDRPYSSRATDRERDMDRPRTGSRSKDLQEPTDSPSRRGNTYDRTDRPTTSSTTTTCTPDQLVHRTESDSKDTSDRSERPTHADRSPRPTHTNRTPVQDGESHRTNQQQDYQEKDQEERREQSHYQPPSAEEYSQEYYDEPEDPPSPPPRTAVRIVKRPFLPSRGGNPNPRGLSPVGSKATTFKKEEEKPTERTTAQERPRNYYLHETAQESARESDQNLRAQQEEKETYDAYKTVQTESQRERRPDEYDTSMVRPAIRRPADRQREEAQKSVEETLVRGSKGQTDSRQNYEEGLGKWPAEDYSNPTQSNEGSVQSSNSPLRGKGRLTAGESPNVYSSAFKNGENQEQPSGPGSFRVKQRINEVTHPLQDIPESEYDVTLNDALTPTLNQEANLPSGFVLPLHRQIGGRDAVLQPSENNYKVSRPVNQQQQQQKPFVPSPQFLPAVASNDRLRAVFYRPSETIQVSGAQYRQQRGPWHDYTGY